MAGDESRIREGPELIIGIVAAVGTDQEKLCQALSNELAQLDYGSETIRISELLREVPLFKDQLASNSLDERYDVFMEAGTRLRETTGRGDSLAVLGMMAIRDRRQATNQDRTKSRPRSAFIFRSLKHPSEVQTLRRVYGSNFILVSAYTPTEQRFQNLATNISASKHRFQARDSYPEAQRLLLRDESEQDRELGQQVRKTFPMADVFIDTSEPAQVRESVRRFVEAFFGHPYHTPTRDEYGMFHAQAAANRSSALGRQVGAAITTEDGDIVVVGTNDVPKAGGGLYWPGDALDKRDFVTGWDVNDRLKHRLLADVLQRLKDTKWLADGYLNQQVDDLLDKISKDRQNPLRQAQVLSVIEYGRCVHAEMAAIVDAARRGVAVGGCTLYTTTFPCHECARHIVAAGIRKVIYIDPYPKSLVSELHPDSIILERDHPQQDRVPFLPFVGIGPRMYLPMFQAAKRKEDSGKVIDWNKVRALPRFEESSVAVKVREEEETIKFTEQLEKLKNPPSLTDISQSPHGRDSG